ncbi:MAG: cache domain-containing protein, partial [Planctomycetota bacterium]
MTEPASSFLPSLQSRPVLRIACCSMILTVPVLLLIAGVVFYQGEALYLEALEDRLARVRTALEVETDRSLTVQTLNLTGKMNQTVRDVLSGVTPPDNPSLLALLEAMRSECRVSLVYVIDSQGLVVGSTRYDSGKTLTGENYAFRPYFRRALQGHDVVYPALGITTLRRGLYFASPVYARDMNLDMQTPIGVLVAKMGVDRIDGILAQQSVPTVLASAEGITFAANRSDLLFTAIGPMTEKNLRRV